MTGRSSRPSPAGSGCPFVRNHKTDSIKRQACHQQMIGIVSWHLLTPPQLDAFYLTACCNLSQRAVATLYHVSQPAVAKHLRRARERLSTTRLLPADPEPVLPRLCAECDTPGLPCRLCLERVMAEAAVYAGNGRGGRAAGGSTRTLDSGAR